MEISALLAFYQNDEMEIDEIAFMVCTTPEKLRDLIKSEKGISILQLLYIVHCDLSGFTIPKDRQIPTEIQAFLYCQSYGPAEQFFSHWYLDPDKRLIELGIVDD
ncbi:MAG: hypothetical protein HRU33_21720 [Rhodobacteraceae bacterium]|nr:hypothetical protein [Paracoccaceae bacterium]